MGQLTNLYVSQSYQGLIKLANSTTGVTGTLQYTQDGLGNNLPIQISTSSVNITGSFTVNGTPISGVDTGSFATTGSNTFYGNQSIISPNAEALFVSGSSQRFRGNSFSIENNSSQTKFIVSNASNIVVSDLPVSASQGITGSLFGTSSYATQALSASYAPSAALPSGVVSGSAQIAAFGYATTSSLDTLSGSIATTDLAQNNRLTSIEGITGSFATTSSLTSLSSSIASTDLAQNNRLGSLESKTGSYATTGSNVFNGSQTISGSLIVTGSITALSASITYLQTVYQTSSVVFSSGSNILGDEASDTQILWGTVKLPTGPLSVTGSVRSTGEIRTDGSVVVGTTLQTNVISNPGTAGDIQINSNAFKVSIYGDTEVTGTLKVTDGITGSLQGTASYATNALSASQSTNANTASYVLQAVSASYATNALSASYANNATSASFSQNTISGSFSNFAVSSSFSDFAISASQAQNAVTASFLTGTIASASYAVNADTASIARDVIVVGKCDNAGGLTRGTVVRITGANGDNPLFDSASWSDEQSSANVLGMLSEDVAFNGFANVVVLGKVLGLNTNAYPASTLLYLSSSGQYTSTVPTAPSQSVRLGQVLRQNSSNGSMYFRADNGYELGELHNVIDTANTTGELLAFESGSYGLWKNQSIGNLGIATTGSVNQKLDTGSFNTYTASMDARTGSYATTGSNRFNGNQIITGSVIITGSLNMSGSIYMKTQNNTGIDYVSQSAENIANFFIGANGSYSTNSGSFVITGSNNFVTAQFPRTVGYINYINGHGNIMLGSAGVLLSTSSIAVNTSANIGGGQMTLNFGTSSLAAPQVSNNQVLAGPNFLSPSGSITAINNQFIGSIQYRATGSTHNSLSTMTNNIFNSTPVFNAVSSSIAMTYNTFGGGTTTINNNYTSSNTTGNQLNVNRNAIFGQNHVLNISGSNDASTNFRAVNDNLIAGIANIVNASAVGTTSGSLTQAMILGANLTVSASNRAGGNDVGSVFLGRNNDTAQGLSESTTTVLAVGTGTSTAAKRTSLHVSSSGLFQIRDSVIISGSMTVTGSATITGSVQGNVLPLTVASNTASLNLNNGNFFELALTGSQDIRIEPSNIKPGQTVNIKLNTTGSGTVSFPTSVKQPSGSAYTPTTAVGTDIITMVSFDSTNLYVANVKNLI